MSEFHAFLGFITADYKIILSVLSVIIGLTGYGFYYRNIIFRDGNRPCIFTWVPIALTVGFGLYAQIENGSGWWGAAPTALTAINCTVLAVISIFSEIKKSEWTDWACFAIALLAIVWWQIGNTLFMPVILVSFADAISFYPTYKRGWRNPHKETAMMWALSCLKFVVGILAIQVFTLETLLFPFTIMMINGTFVAIILLRRRFLEKQMASCEGSNDVL